MNFLSKGVLPDSRLLRLILCLTLVYFIALSCASVLLFAENTGLSYDSVAAYYLGSEDGFREAASYRGLLETAHFHLFSMAMALLLATHLAVFTGLSQRLKLFLIIASFGGGLLDIASGWLVRFASAYFAWLKIFSFLVFNASFLALSVISFLSLVYGLTKDGGDGRG